MNTMGDMVVLCSNIDSKLMIGGVTYFSPIICVENKIQYNITTFMGEGDSIFQHFKKIRSKVMVTRLNFFLVRDYL